MTMDETTRTNIRQIFLSRRPSYALMTASMLLGMSFRDLKREIEVGVIVAVSTRLGQRVASEEMIAAAMRVWEQAAIEEALGSDAASCCRRPSDWWTCVPGCRGISGRCCTNSPDAMAPRSTRC
jgi:hypothetical protein